MNEGLTRFNSLGNKFFQHLEGSHGAHITARQKHGMLLDELQNSRVAFKDIQNRLEKEAKACGLWRKTMWDHGKMVFPKLSVMRQNKVNWVVAMDNFLRWIKANYKDYGVEVDRKARKATHRIDERKKVVAVTRTVTENGEVSERRVETVGATRDELTGNGSNPVNSPVKTGLTKIQVQQVILQNWSVLAEICEEKGAVEEFNLLMDALGLHDEMINLFPEEEDERSQIPMDMASSGMMQAISQGQTFPVPVRH